MHKKSKSQHRDYKWFYVIFCGSCKINASGRKCINGITNGIVESLILNLLCGMLFQQFYYLISFCFLFPWVFCIRSSQNEYVGNVSICCFSFLRFVAFCYKEKYFRVIYSIFMKMNFTIHRKCLGNRP